MEAKLEAIFDREKMRSLQSSIRFNSGLILDLLFDIINSKNEVYTNLFFKDLYKRSTVVKVKTISNQNLPSEKYKIIRF